MTDKKLVVFDTRNAQSVLLDYFTHIYSQQPLIGLVQPNRIQMMHVVHSIISEIFEERDRNIVGNSETDWDVVRAAILFGVSPGQILHRQVKFSDKVFDHPAIETLWVDLRHQVDAHSTLLSYDKWDVINTGSTIVAIEKGDQRLLQWQELQSAQGDSYHRLNLIRVFDEFKAEFTKTHGPYPESQLDAMVLKAVLDMFPQLKVTNAVESVNHDIAAAYGIPPLHEWLDAYMRQVMTAFNVSAFGVHIPAGPKYECEYFNHILTVRAIREEETMEVVDTDKELAMQLMRGDYLPREERERAERYILENH